ncbi:MAG TPA: uroporphyrinogen-III synthase [Sediminibacterium sp.]|nr:uroporphyrinogen-III synthase [Sediminibacterium sp.]
MSDLIHILSTGPLTGHPVPEGFVVDEYSFIATVPVLNAEIQEEIRQLSLQSVIVVFTSVQAVETVAAALDDFQPDWRIYCMGQATQDKIRELFGETSIAGTGHTALTLAHHLLENEPDAVEAFFFCGDKRRPELPDFLRSNGVEVVELVVYQTLLTPVQLKKQYQAILFYSPSAVESFFAVNIVPAETMLFAIGSTTAKRIADLCRNRVIQAAIPGKQALLEAAIGYFNQSSSLTTH